MRSLVVSFDTLMTTLFLFRKDYTPFHHINLLKIFKEKAFGLNFTCELPDNNCLQFLHRLLLQRDHVCWCFSPRSLLGYSSGHSKVIKNATAMNSLQSALKKSCIHKCKDSFQQQVDRLKNAGFPAHVLVSASERLIKKCKSRPVETAEPDDKSRKYAIMPYVHRLSHRLKKINVLTSTFSFLRTEKLEKLVLRLKREPEEQWV